MHYQLLTTAAVTAVAATSCLAVPALAQSSTIRFAIAEQSLDRALNELALQSNRQLIVDSTLVRNRRSQALQGRFALEQALDTLLSGTGLSYRVGASSIIIRKGSGGTQHTAERRLQGSASDGALTQGGAENGAVGAVAAGDAEAPGQEPAPIIVTGSRLARSGYDTPQPVEAIDAEAIQATGLSNIADVLSRSPQVGVGLGQSNSYYNADAGASFINLRGLGTNRTLVLVNGRRRVAGTETSSAVDLTTIPSNMVDKVEVITGGASAVYGADAVTGVVNVTLKSHVNGLELTGRSGISSRGDAASYSLGGIVGSDFADERGSVVVGVSYNRERPLMARQRSFGRQQVALFNNPDNTGPDDGIYDAVAVPDYRYNGTPYGGNFPIGGTSYTYDANGVRPVSNTASTANYAAGGDGFNDADFAPLRNGSKVFAATAHLEYEISDAIQLFADGQYARTKASSPLQPTFDSAGDFTLSYDNPLIPDDIRALMDEAGETTLTFGRTNWDQGQQYRYVDRDTVTGVLGLQGDLGQFHWMGFYQYGRYEADSRVTHDRITSRFAQALDAVQLGDGSIVCRDDDARAAGCVPINVFGPSAASDDAVAYFDYSERRKVVNTQQVAGAQIDGDAFELPAGPVQVALGIEWRKETTRAQADPRAEAGELWRVADNSIKADFNVKEAFGEVLVPILADQPFARELSLEGAARISDYSTIGTTWTWKLGGQWAPNRDIRFRVTRSRSVRAPNLSELYSPGTVSNVNLLDPCSAARVNLEPNRADNCAALGLPTNYTDPQANAYKTVITGGNADLNAEKSKSWTAGAVITPGFLPGVIAR
ncbi:TonB-dependent receptor [Novosphingobium sp. MBES04]|nr:TonB-dependent receptor [Novosphingobium sp. MBES04]